jgi:cytoskeleton protein RodZ
MNDTSMNQALSTGDEEQKESANVLRQHEQQPEQQFRTVEPSIGTRLAAERDGRGWSIEQVASQLNLAARQIQALEQDNFAALPGMASVRGFIRAYAKLLKIDATPLIAMLAAEAAPPPIEPLHSRRPLTAPFSDEKHLPSNGTGPSSSKPVVLALSMAVVAAAAFAAYQFGWLHLPSMPPSATGAPASVPAEQASAPEQSVVEAPVQESKEAAGAPAIAAQGSESSAPTAAVAAPVARVATPAATPAPAPVPAEKPAVTGKNTLVLKMREQSWIEVRRVGEAARGTSNVLLSRLDRAGATEAIEVTEPVAVTIGNAGGVDATLRGAPVDLKADAKSNVAHLNLK